MRSKFAVFSLAAFAALAGPAMADRSMLCDFPDTRAAGFARGDVHFSMKTGDSEATLRSAVTQHFQMGDVKAKVVRDTPKALILSWFVDVKNDRNQYAKIKYTLKVMGDGSKAYYRAAPLAYDNEFNSAGSCKPVKG